ncbi:MAG TPA: LacI family DNA-binding transcriptional regulator [Candidatus Merdenecus merdavium]|nr:LacI family DNA-binding transcriptional regulator [Candidatus Merdenecus merdavium]
MGKKKITSTDIAKAAGVSQATVSMVLNKKYNVSFSKSTIDKVESTAAKLGYSLPKHRVKKGTKLQKLIVAFCPTITNPYYVMLMQGIEEVARENGYGVFVCNTQRDLKREKNYLKMMQEVKPLGIIYLCNPSFTKEVEELSEDIPIVIIGNKEEDLEVDTVELNNTKPGRMMARHLLDLGHKKVAFISPPLTKRQPARIKRVEGFRQEFRKAGLESFLTIKSADDNLDLMIPTIDSEFKMGYHLTKELLQEEKDFTAIIGLNDMIAFGILEALQEEKYRIPSDISVMGCDNTLFSRFHGISLTTIDHFVPLKGRDACDIIVKKINSSKSYNIETKPTSIYHVEYEPRLIARGTTSYPKDHKKR